MLCLARVRPHQRIATYGVRLSITNYPQLPDMRRVAEVARISILHRAYLGGWNLWTFGLPC